MEKQNKIIKKILADAGITINGSRPWDIQVYNTSFYNKVLRKGSIGLGESYMDGLWDCKNIDQLFYKILTSEMESSIKISIVSSLKIVLNLILNPGRKSKAFHIGEKHYDIGNDLYKIMLDKRMAYTCGYWEDAQNLNEAQEAKLDIICRKIGIKSGQSVLDIGSGWGSFIGYAAEKYGAIATGITVSKEQKILADNLYKNTSVKTELQDYRDVKKKFNHVVSIGMFEHVGVRNYRTFMKVAHDAMNDDGLFLLHTIGGNQSVKTTDPWISKYIFPNSMLPSISQISKSVEGLFIIEDIHNFGMDYDKTLMAWYDNFESNWNKLESNYDKRFYRMWKYYLLSCAGSFRARKNQLWQIVLSKKKTSNRYKSIR